MTRATVALVAVLCFACRDSTPPPPPGVDIAITGQTTSPREPWITVISFAVTNGSAVIVYLPRCGDQLSVAVERLTDGSWVNAGAAVCPANLRADPLELPPGAYLEATAAVAGVGRFRLRTGASTAPAAPMDWRLYSAAFEIF